LLARALGVDAVHLASDAQVREAAKTVAGFVGPLGFSGKIIADPEVAAMSDAVSGAMQQDYHYRHLAYGRDFQGQVSQIRMIAEGDPCPNCGAELVFYRGIEGGHIFVLGTHYSAKMNARFIDEDGKEKPFVMGCYGIGVSRLVATIIEQHHDEQGISWPMAVAPYQVHLVSLGKQSEVSEKADAIYSELCKLGVDVLYDDRDERPGVKFKDADLVGIPLRVTVGGKGLERGIAEVKWRNQKDIMEVPLVECVQKVYLQLHPKGA
jgi:prolyl-tRNA synthetase